MLESNSGSSKRVLDATTRPFFFEHGRRPGVLPSPTFSVGTIFSIRPSGPRPLSTFVEPAPRMRGGPFVVLGPRPRCDWRSTAARPVILARHASNSLLIGRRQSSPTPRIRHNASNRRLARAGPRLHRRILSAPTRGRRRFTIRWIGSLVPEALSHPDSRRRCSSSAVPARLSLGRLRASTKPPLALVLEWSGVQRPPAATHSRTRGPISSPSGCRGSWLGARPSATWPPS